MNTLFYFPCNRSGRCLNGFCPTTGSSDSLKRDIRSWVVFSSSIKFVSVDGVVRSIKSLAY